MDMAKLTALPLAALAAALPLAAGAAGVSFDSLYRGVSLLKDLPAAAPAVTKAARAETAAPELAYEDIVEAPVWKRGEGAAGASDLKAGFLPARHQGGRNMCNSFAATGLAEYLAGLKTGAAPDLSEEFLYYNAKLKFTDEPELQSYKSEPGLAGYVAVLALKGGVAAEKDWPFLPKLPPHTPKPPLTDPDLGAPPAGIYGRLLPYRFAPVAVRRSEIKEFLAKERRPVVMNLMLYTGNIDNSTGRLADPTPAQRAQCFSKGDNCGGHVVLLTGYDPAAKEYLFRNSWGTAWGKDGFGRLTEKYLDENCECCHYLGQLKNLDAGGRAMTVNASYGWSAGLE